MSGGSFDYLCFQDGASALKSGSLIAMLEELHRSFPDSTATRDTAALLALRDTIDRRVEALHDVWQAVEWWRSCDWSRESADRAIREYEQRASLADITGAPA